MAISKQETEFAVRLETYTKPCLKIQLLCLNMGHALDFEAVVLSSNWEIKKELR